MVWWRRLVRSGDLLLLAGRKPGDRTRHAVGGSEELAVWEIEPE